MAQPGWPDERARGGARHCSEIKALLRGAFEQRVLRTTFRTWKSTTVDPAPHSLLRANFIAVEPQID